jgi:hypothetical protein
VKAYAEIKVGDGVGIRLVSTDDSSSVGGAADGTTVVAGDVDGP